MAEMDPTVFIVDDDPSAQRGLMRLVRAAGLRAESHDSASAFLASPNRHGPGCIVLDVKMPEMNGLELQEKLSEDECTLPIIFLSAHGDVPTTALAMKKGAVDFLTKPVDRRDLLSAIRASLKKDAEERARRIKKASATGLVGSLSPREHEVMTFVITGMLNKQIASELGISEETVKIHRGHMMRKLGIVSVAELVRLCNQAGVEPAGDNK
jgi:FixJ family two-component response regulator